MHRYVVTKAGLATPGILALELRPEPGERPLVFEPGQYAAISFWRHGRPTPARCFSLASSPTEQGMLQFGIRLAGKFTHALAQIQPDERVGVRGPYGRFVLRTDLYQRVVLCAGGIGITPLLSMIRYAAAVHAATDITLIYSVRGQADAAFLSDIKQLVVTNPHLHVIFVSADGPTDQLAPARIFNGRISDEVISAADPRNEATYFLCGPPPFMNAVTHMLLARGIGRSRILSEAFSQGPIRQTSRRWSWPANMYALGAVGTAAASVAVVASDISKSLPASLMAETLSSAQSPSSTTSQRQQDLDTLVNSLPPVSSTSVSSPALAAAEVAAVPAATPVPVVAQAPSASSGTTTKTASGGATTSVSAPTTVKITPAPVVITPTPKPAPVCTTSPSGVKTCV